MEELFIITEGGQLIFSWHPRNLSKDSKQDDDLITGFLSALNSFATLERGEDIKSLKLKETTIIFEKNDDLVQKLTFVITTKNELLIEICHSIVHDLMDLFLKTYEDILNREFDGEISKFLPFSQQVEKIVYNHGLDILNDSVIEINKGGIMKSITLIEPKSAQIFYIHSKQYVDKDKLSFLIPLIANSSRLLYKNNLGENVRWILLTTARSEIMLVEIRNKLLIIKQYQLEKNIENDFLSLEYFKNKDVYVKKPKKVVKTFENLIWSPKIKQLFLVDLVGKILYSRIFDESYNCMDYIPETISFLTSSKKTSEQIYNQVLFHSTIGGDKQLTTICINFNNLALILIGDIHELSDFKVIENICEEIVIQLI
ncbi:MAG: hypothetical protein ACFFBP_05670 [Promethearchaeota archaeon]